jgi:bifunctional non-homologous end joining protein LigD
MPETRDYAAKRTFDETPEPPPAVAGNVDPTTAVPGETFMVHQHHATRLHFDLRLEMYNGATPVLVSWAVPKNLPQKKGQRHLAVHVEDHPFEYGSFSGTIPKGNYGAGEVRIFDNGTYEVLEQEPQKLTIRLQGDRLRGVWHMIQTRRAGEDEDKPEWLVFLRENSRPEPEPLPELRPMLATLAADAFDDAGWLFEPKWDGVRALATCTDETLLVSRTMKDMTATYPDLGKLHERLVALDAIVDGEIVAMKDGRPSFELLQGRINLSNPREIQRIAKEIPVRFIAFDILYLDGRSLIGLPLEERKEILEGVVVSGGNVDVSTTIPEDGVALFEAAKAQHLEGIVAKKLGTPYRPGKRSRDWLKVKTVYDADVVIGGWTPGEGSRSSRFGALLVGTYEDGALRFNGSVGTGFNDQALSDLLGAMQPLASVDNPFSTDPRKDKASWGKPVRNPRWIEPKLVAQVEFRELTSAGKLRAPSFKGLRSDKDPEDCLYEDLFPPET